MRTLCAGLLGLAAAISAFFLAEGERLLPAGAGRVFIVNGLAAEAEAAAGALRIRLAPGEAKEIPRGADWEIPVSAFIGETYAETVLLAFPKDRKETLVYNLAGAAPLVEWTAVYGSGGVPGAPDGRATKRLGSPRLLLTKAETLFGDPPKTLKTGNGSQTRLVLSAPAKTAPERLAGLTESRTQALATIEAQARWNPPDAETSLRWLSLLLAESPRATDVLRARLARRPDDLMARRLLDGVLSQEDTPGASADDIWR